ncbi:MAG: HPr family phosphocarrier protein, partial [Deltaproteobacteria bacterium]
GRHTLILDQVTPDRTMKNIEADAFITIIPNLALMIKLADCQGTILFDPKQKVLAVVHCGWRGHVKDIYGHVVEKMTKNFDCNPADIHAAISPSLGPCCAEFKTYAAKIVQTSSQFQSSIRLVKNGREADAKSMLDILTLSCPQGTRIELRAEGKDAGEALAALAVLFDNKFGEE